MYLHKAGIRSRPPPTDYYPPQLIFPFGPDFSAFTAPYLLLLEINTSIEIFCIFLRIKFLRNFRQKFFSQLFSLFHLQSSKDRKSVFAFQHRISLDWLVLFFVFLSIQGAVKIG